MHPLFRRPPRPCRRPAADRHGRREPGVPAAPAGRGAAGRGVAGRGHAAAGQRPAAAGEAQAAGGPRRRSAAGDQRRALRLARRPAAARHRHLHPRGRDDPVGRAAARGQCRAASEAARRRWRGCSAIARRRSRKACTSSAASTSRSTSCATNIRTSRCPTAGPPQGWLEHLVMEEAQRAPSRTACRPRWRQGAGRGVRPHPQMQIRQLFPDRPRHRPLRAGAGSADPLPGARLGGQSAWSAICSASPRSIRSRTTCSSPASCPRSAASRPTSTSISSMSGARR